MIDPLINRLLLMPGPDAQARLAHEAAPALVRAPGTADRLVNAVLNETERAVGMQLLVPCLDQARMAVENSQSGGAAFLASVADRLAAARQSGAITPQLGQALAGCYARAGLEAPPALLLVTGRSAPVPASLQRQPRGSRSSPEAAMDAAIDKLVHEHDGTPLQLHGALAELFATLPLPVRSMMVHRIAGRAGATHERLAAFWLLDPAAETRRAAAQALSERARAGAWSPRLRHDVRQLIEWLPAGRERDVLHTLLAGCDGDEAPTPRHAAARPKSAARPAWRIADVLVSMPDGAGCQSLTLSAVRGRDHAVAVGLLKRGHGVKDAFVVPCGSKAERQGMIHTIAGELPMLPVSAAFARIALGRALADGIAATALPSPGLLELVEFTGALAPLPHAPADILASLSPETHALLATKAQVRQLAGRGSHRLWEEELFDSWFEQTEALDERMAGAGTTAAAQAIIWEQLAARRHWWAGQLALAAATAEATPVPTPLAGACLAAAATALLGNGSLKTVAAMQAVMAATLEAYQGRNAEPMVPAAGQISSSAAVAAISVAQALTVAGLPPAFLQGWGAALAAAPIPPSPRQGMETLLVRLAGAPVECVDGLLAAVSAALNTAVDAAADPAALRQCLRQHTLVESGHWCSGFAAMVAASKRCWPQKRLGPDGKSLLGLIAAGAPNGLAAGERETVARLLPQLVAGASVPD